MGRGTCRLPRRPSRHLTEQGELYLRPTWRVCCGTRCPPAANPDATQAGPGRSRLLRRASGVGVRGALPVGVRGVHPQSLLPRTRPRGRSPRRDRRPPAATLRRDARRMQHGYGVGNLERSRQRDMRCAAYFRGPGDPIGVTILPDSMPPLTTTLRAQAVEAIQRWGTPLYLTDLDVAAANLLGLPPRLPGALIAYAVKANPDPRLLGRLRRRRRGRRGGHRRGAGARPPRRHSPRSGSS